MIFIAPFSIGIFSFISVFLSQRVCAMVQFINRSFQITYLLDELAILGVEVVTYGGLLFQHVLQPVDVALEHVCVCFVLVLLVLAKLVFQLKIRLDLGDMSVEAIYFVLLSLICFRHLLLNLSDLSVFHLHLGLELFRMLKLNDLQTFFLLSECLSQD